MRLRRLLFTLPMSVRSVGPLVPDNVALLAEPFWAQGASVGLFAGVGPLVPRNVALVLSRDDQ